MQTLINILTNDHNVIMQYEIAIMLCVFFVSAALFRTEKKLAAVWTAVFLFFVYIHRALLPFLVSGVYLLALSGIICAFVNLDPKAFFLPEKELVRKSKLFLSRPMLPYTAIILVILLIQICRVNICLDYDSIRYGLRSDVLLTGGHGIAGFFENTGLVNNVYTYPKGYELLTRPLYFGNTLGYVLCVNIWMMTAVLLMVGEITSLAADSSGAAVFATMIAALIPGITNMAITAKSDLITVLCQLIFIYCVAKYIRKDEKAPELTGIGIGALILSYAFKPTAVIFSSFIGLAVIGYFAFHKISLRFNAKGIRALVPALIFTAVITLRTLLITGQPFTSVFTGSFEKIGLKLKYPFRAQGFIYTDETVSAADKISGYIRRLFGFLFCPVGEDMSHVIIAWGGIAFLIMVIVLLIFVRGTSGKMKELNNLSEVEGGGFRFYPEVFDFLKYIWIAAGVLSLISLYMLYQVDGNYFMLIYSLSAAAGSVVLFTGAQYELSALGRNLPKIMSSNNPAAVILLCAVMIWFTAFTSWRGAIGFSKIDFVNKGYYNHETEYLVDLGEWDKNARVLAMAHEPDCYRIKGRVESWVDVDGSGGNVYLTDTIFNIFKEYLAFADIDYIYADLSYINDNTNSRRERAKELFVWLLEDGSFEDVHLIEGSGTQIAAKINKDRVAVDWETEMSDELLEKIADQKIWYDSIQK